MLRSSRLTWFSPPLTHNKGLTLNSSMNLEVAVGIRGRFLNLLVLEGPWGPQGREKPVKSRHKNRLKFNTGFLKNMYISCYMCTIIWLKLNWSLLYYYKVIMQSTNVNGFLFMKEKYSSILNKAIGCRQRGHLGRNSIKKRKTQKKPKKIKKRWVL